jgi:hypothetical protein
VHIQRLAASHAPVFLVNSRLGLVTATPSRFDREGLHANEVSLLPKLRDQFAEFLNQSSSARLRILYAPTCVGLRYGQSDHSLEVFLDSMASETSPVCGSASHLRIAPADLPTRTPYVLTPGQPTPGIS